MQQQYYLDNQYNLIYFLTQPQPQKSSGVLSKLSSTSHEPYGATNVLVWDVPKRAKSNLFAAGELSPTEYIRSITFEQGYDAQKKQLIFNDYTHVVRNTPLFERAPREMLIIEVIDHATHQLTLWTCDKWGIRKAKLMPFPSHAQWHLDIFNGTLRIMEWQNNDVRIVEVEW